MERISFIHSSKQVQNGSNSQMLPSWSGAESPGPDKRCRIKVRMVEVHSELLLKGTVKE